MTIIIDSKKNDDLFYKILIHHLIRQGIKYHNAEVVIK